eukprot:4463079-Amphidinium_carterae.1
MFHPNAEAHTHRYLKVMNLPIQSFDRANMVRMEPPVRLQLLMHYIRVLPADPIEQDLVQKAFLYPPGECTTTTGVLDELVRWKGLGWRYRLLQKDEEALSDHPRNVQGFY